MQSTLNGNNDQKTLKDRKTYLKYTREMRLELIKLVQENKMATAEAARLVGIKQTSACRIMNSFRRHNRIFERKADRQLRTTIQALERPQKILPLQKQFINKQGSNLSNLDSSKERDIDQGLVIKHAEFQNRKPSYIIPQEFSQTVQMGVQMTPNIMNNNWSHVYATGIWNWPYHYQFY